MKRTKRRRNLLGYLLLAGLAPATTTLAGAIFFAGSLSEKDEFTPSEKVKAPCFAVRYSEIALDVTNGQVRVSVREKIEIPDAAAADFVALFPLPEDADPKTLEVAVGGTEAATRLDVECHGKDKARAILASVAQKTGSTAILAFSGRPLAAVRKAPAKPELNLSISYRQPVRDDRGFLTARAPMPDAAFMSSPVQRVTLTANVHDPRPLRAMFCTSHNCDIERPDVNRATVRVVADQLASGRDFLLHYVADPTEMGLRVLTHREAGNEDGFFLLVGNPSGGHRDQAPVPKDILFVLDISGSMRGEKMEQARSAIEYCLDHLNAGDRFNVIAFGSDVASFRPEPVANTPEQVKAAKVFVDELVPRGRTNIHDALAKGLAGKPDETRPRMMIFLTDGTPTAGERSPKKIMEAVPEMNASKTRVFVMGVGHDVNTRLLDRIAEACNGSSEYVDEGEEIDVKVAALYNRLSYPFLNDVEMDFGKLAVKTVFPKALPALFRGSEVMVAGRYRGGGAHAVRILGTLHGKPQEYACSAEFPTNACADNAFIAPLWATRCIGFYLQEIRLHGEKDELVEEIVRLSRKYGIVTEYTAFLADGSGGALNPTDAAREVRRRLNEGGRAESGKWAVIQSVNAKELQQRTVMASPEANVFRDKQGKVHRADGVRQVGKAAFYQKDDQWVEAEEQGDRKMRVVKKFSQEYFDLLEKSDKFREAQALDKPVEINVGNERIQVQQ